MHMPHGRNSNLFFLTSLNNNRTMCAHTPCTVAHSQTKANPLGKVEGSKQAVQGEQRTDRTTLSFSALSAVVFFFIFAFFCSPLPALMCVAPPSISSAPSFALSRCQLMLRVSLALFCLFTPFSLPLLTGATRSVQNNRRTAMRWYK